MAQYGNNLYQNNAGDFQVGMRRAPNEIQYPLEERADAKPTPVLPAGLWRCKLEDTCGENMNCYKTPLGADCRSCDQGMVPVGIQYNTKVCRPKHLKKPHHF